MPPRLILPMLCAALAPLVLAACVTPQVKPTVSKAVLQARANGRAPARQAQAGCGEMTSPVSVGFPFEEGALSDLDTPALQAIAAALACRPEAVAVIVGQADNHGTAADQTKLAGERAQAVVDDLQKRGVAAERMQTQVEGKVPDGSDLRLIVLAEGRRW